MGDRKVKAKQINFHRKKNLAYFEVSAKSNFNYEKPFLYLARQLVGDGNPKLVESLALHPQTVTIDPQRMQEIQRELGDAAQCPLGDDDGDL